jgi:hypothetical protein
MDNTIAKAYYWEDIIRLAFSPSGASEQYKWLKCFSKDVKDFWGIGDFPKLTKNLKGEINNKYLNFIVSYTISDNKWAATFFYQSKNQNSLMWIQDVDLDYFVFPNQIFLSDYGQRNEAAREINPDNIISTLDSLIFHPTPHQHLESPIDNHEVRIGGGIYNPFLYLFHIRYQFCPDNEMKGKERTRLVELLSKAIKSNNRVSAGELFNINY